MTNPNRKKDIQMRYLTSFFFVLSFAIILWPTSALADRVTLDVPDMAENGNSVPVRVTLDRPLAANECLTIFVNGEIAAQVTADTAVELTEFSTKVRLLCTDCTVSATMAADGFLVDAWDKKVKTLVAGSIPENEFDGDHKIHAMGRGHKMQIMINKKMSKSSHLTKVAVRTREGVVEVQTTLYISYIPYFGFKSTNSVAGITDSDVNWWYLDRQ